jgi:uncharacterized protein with GYD domain
VPRYVLFVAYTPESWAAMIEEPGDRAAAANEAAAAAGGRLLSLDFMFGRYDAIAVVEMPTSVGAAALSVAVASTGAFRTVETHELIAPAELPAILDRAKAVTRVYSPPGV